MPRTSARACQQPISPAAAPPPETEGDAGFEPACTAREHARNAEINARLFSSISSEMTPTIPPNCSEARRFVSRCVISPHLGKGAHCRRYGRRAGGHQRLRLPRPNGAFWGQCPSRWPSSGAAVRLVGRPPSRLSLVARLLRPASKRRALVAHATPKAEGCRPSAWPSGLAAPDGFSPATAWPTGPVRPMILGGPGQLGVSSRAWVW